MIYSEPARHSLAEFPRQLASIASGRGWRLFLLLPLATVGLVACGGDGDASGEAADDELEGTIPAVEAVQARRGALPLRERLTGTVRAAGQVEIYSETSGPITQVFAENGDFVEQGDPLVRIEGRTSQSQLAQAQANLASARADASGAAANLEELEAQFRRTQLLAEDDLVSAEALETEQARVQAARASYEQAEAQVAAAQAVIDERQEAVGRTTIRAPISGVVGQRNAEVGMIADGQSRLFMMGRMENMRVRVPVAQELLGQLRQGQRTEILAESLPGQPIEAEISRISPFLAEGSFSAEAEIDLPNTGGRLIPGMFVEVDVFYGESDTTTLIPKSALYEHPDLGQEGVYIATSLGSEIQPAIPAEDEAAGPLTQPVLTRFRPVEILADGRQEVGVQGVESGEWVVVVGQHLLAGEGTADEPARARVRPITWKHIVSLQSLQREDLLQRVMEKQRRLAQAAADTAGRGTSGTGEEREL